MIRNKYVAAVLLVVVCLGCLYCDLLADWVLRIL